MKIIATTLAFFVTFLNVSAAFNPYWWNEFKVDGTPGGYGILNTSKAPPDDSPVTLGQLKHFVDKSKDYLDDYFSGGPGAAVDKTGVSVTGGAGTAVNKLTTSSWFTVTSNNNHPLTVGQLRGVGKVIYDRILEIYPSDVVPTNNWYPYRWDSDWLVSDGYRFVDPTSYPVRSQWAAATPNLWKKIHPNSPYPWIAATANDSNSSIATIAQLKFVFSFEFPVVPDEPKFWDANTFIRSYNGTPFPTNTTNSVRYGQYVSRMQINDNSGNLVQVLQEAYSPNLNPGEKAPLYILLPGYPSPITANRHVNQNVFRYFCQTGKYRANYIMFASSTAGLAPTGGATEGLISKIIEDAIDGGFTNLPMAVDPDRVYLMGFSGGGISIQYLLDQAPKRYAAALLNGSGRTSFGWGTTEVSKNQFAAKIGHVPMLWARAEAENNRGVFTVAEYEDRVQRLSLHNPETFLLQVRGGHSPTSATAQIQNIRWLSEKKRAQ